MTSWQATLATAPHRGVNTWVAWVGGGGMWQVTGTEVVVGSPLGFFSDPLLPLSSFPTLSSHASLLLAALPLLHRGRERRGFLALLSSPLPPSWPLAVFGVTEPQLQPGCLSNTANHTRCPLHFSHLKDD